jgi:O-antigen/teichoic acid export membrane protein
LAIRRERLISHNLIVTVGTLSAGMLGFVFQSVISHRLAPSEYAGVFAVLALVTTLGLPSSAITLMMAREASRDHAAGQRAASTALLVEGNRYLLLAGGALALVLIAASPFLAVFLKTSTALIIYAACGMPFGLALPLASGALQGDQRFGSLASIYVSQASLKLAAALLFSIPLGPSGIVLGISVASLVTYLIAVGMLRRRLAIKVRWPWWRAVREYLPVVLPSSLALAVLFNADVVLVKHFFAPSVAGQYSAVAALSRAIYFAAGGVAAVLFPKVIFRETKGEAGGHLIWASIALVAIGGLAGLVLLSVRANVFLTYFAGSNYVGGAHYLPWYALAMTLLGSAAVLIATHQSRGELTFLAALLPISLLEPALIAIFHQSLMQVLAVMNASLAVLVVSLGWLLLSRPAVERTVAFSEDQLQVPSAERGVL